MISHYRVVYMWLPYLLSGEISIRAIMIRLSTESEKDVSHPSG
jgi:hypothetical protein